MKKNILIISLLFFSLTLYSQHKEVYYQKLFSTIIKGEMEVVLDDQARVDIVTDEYTIEVDFAKKWAESIGQSLYYSNKLNKKAGVLLIVNGKSDDKFIKRLLNVANTNHITVWLMNYNDDSWVRILNN